MNNSSPENNKTNKVSTKQSIFRWLAVALLILFLLLIITLPLVIDRLYSDKTENPGRLITYERNNLKWGYEIEVDENGTAMLDLFDATYDNVASGDGANVIAPGTEGTDTLQMQNKVRGSVTYTAVLYMIKDDGRLPVNASLNGLDFTDTDSYVLPEGVEEQQVIRAVTGELDGGELVDFEISWLWEYDESVDQDVIDTILGNEAGSDGITVGLYVTVEDENVYFSFLNPNINMLLYVLLLLVVLAALILFIIFWIRAKKEENGEEMNEAN